MDASCINSTDISMHVNTQGSRHTVIHIICASLLDGGLIQSLPDQQLEVGESSPGDTGH